MGRGGRPGRPNGWPGCLRLGGLGDQGEGGVAEQVADAAAACVGKLRERGMLSVGEPGACADVEFLVGREGGSASAWCALCGHTAFLTVR